MSKRNNRSLAVVAGAALALGSMAPAMAARIDAGGAATADIDVSDVTVPSAGSLVPMTEIKGLVGATVGTVHETKTALIADLKGLRTEVFGIVGGLLDATSSVDIDANGNVNAASGGTVNVTADVSGALGAAGLLDAVPGPGDLVGMVSPFVGTATGAVDASLVLAGSAKGIVFSTAGGLLGTGFDLLDGISASGEVNVIAGLMGSL